MGTTKYYEKFANKVWLNSPAMHGPRLEYVMEVYESNWISTVGANISEMECFTCERVGYKCSVAPSTGAAALHMAVKSAGIKYGDRALCSDPIFGAIVSPVIYEGGILVFVDTEYDTWNMNLAALERAFEIYPDVEAAVVAYSYGTPGKIGEIKSIYDKHGAVIVGDAVEPLSTTYKGIQTGSFGVYNCISYNGDRIITGPSGGMLLTGDLDAIDRVRKWSTQARENTPRYQRGELGYNYRMSNLIADVVRGQYPYLEEHIKRKKEIYERYKKGLSGLPVRMNPYDSSKSEPNFRPSCMLIDEMTVCKQVREEKEALYISRSGESCPTEISENLSKCNAEGRLIWKPAHVQSIYRMNGFIIRSGNVGTNTNTYLESENKGKDGMSLNVGMNIFHQGLYLPSGNKMTAPQQEATVEIIGNCFE